MLIMKSWFYLQVSHYLDKGSVSGDVNQVKAIERKSYGSGYGSDSGGGNTVELLK